MDIQLTHLGQAYVRFKNAFGRDQLIQLGRFLSVMSVLPLLNSTKEEIEGLFSLITNAGLCY